MPFRSQGRKAAVVFVVAGLAVGGLSALPTHFASASTGQSITVKASDDAYTERTAADPNTGGYRMVRVGGTDKFRFGFLKFKVAGLNGTVSSAVLTMKVYESYANTIEVRPADQNVWTEATLRDSNKPGNGAVLDTVTNMKAGQIVSLDVSKFVDSNGTFSLGLLPSAWETRVGSFVSKEGGYAPTLTITTKPKPTTSTTVASRPQASSKPDASNTGVPSGRALKVIDGDVVITQDGTTYDGYDIRGYVKVRAANVTIKNSIVRGSAATPSGNTALIDCNSPNVQNAVIDSVTLNPTKPNLWIDGVIGHNYSANKVNVSNTVDGFGVYNATGDKKYDNVSITNSYIHDMSSFNVDPNHANGPTHNDGIQVQGGANVVIKGNSINGMKSTTSGDQNTPIKQLANIILVQNNVSPVANIDIEYNWLNGGSNGLYVKPADRFPGPFNIGTIAHNRFTADGYDYGNGSRYQLRIENKALDHFDAPVTSNVWDATGAPLAEGRNLGIRYDG